MGQLDPATSPDGSTPSRRRSPTGVGKHRIQIMLPDAYHERLYALAAAEGLSVSEIVRRELRTFLFGTTVPYGDLS